MSPNNYGPIRALFEKNFMWLPGDYEAIVKATTSNAKVETVVSMRFTLHESDSNDLRAYSDDYAHGGGVFYKIEAHTGVNLGVTRQ